MEPVVNFAVPLAGALFENDVNVVLPVEMSVVSLPLSSGSNQRSTNLDQGVRTRRRLVTMRGRRPRRG